MTVFSFQSLDDETALQQRIQPASMMKRVSTADYADLTDYWVVLLGLMESVVMQFSTTDYTITNEETGGRWSDYFDRTHGM